MQCEEVHEGSLVMGAEWEAAVDVREVGETVGPLTLKEPRVSPYFGLYALGAKRENLKTEDLRMWVMGAVGVSRCPTCCARHSKSPAKPYSLEVLETAPPEERMGTTVNLPLYSKIPGSS